MIVNVPVQINSTHTILVTRDTFDTQKVSILRNKPISIALGAIKRFYLSLG